MRQSWPAISPMLNREFVSLGESQTSESSRALADYVNAWAKVGVQVGYGVD